jgi:hypothetical protein
LSWLLIVITSFPVLADRFADDQSRIAKHPQVYRQVIEEMTALTYQERDEVPPLNATPRFGRNTQIVTPDDADARDTKGVWGVKNGRASWCGPRKGSGEAISH